MDQELRNEIKEYVVSIVSTLLVKGRDIIGEVNSLLNLDLDKQDRWDRRFIELAQYIAQWSKDRSTKVGCVLVGPDRDIRSVGYNGFPRGVDDTVEIRHQRPAKYLWTEHAERNAIYNAAKGHTDLTGCTAYVPWFPCMDCARALVQSGIQTVVAFRPNFDDPKWGEDFKNTVVLLEEAGLIVRYVAGEIKR